MSRNPPDRRRGDRVGDRLSPSGGEQIQNSDAPRPRFLRRIRLAQIRPRVWGAAYLLLIPAFAVVFWRLPGRPFYHATIQYEASLNDDAGPLLEVVRERIVANFRACQHGDRVESGGWSLDIKDLRLTGIRPTADEIGFKASIRLTRSSKEGTLEGVTQMPFAMTYPASQRDYSLSLAPGARAIFSKTLTFQPDHLDVVDLEGEPRLKPLSYSLLFPRCSVPNYAAPTLDLSAELNERVQDFWRATRGLPTGVSGGFARMFYLSAMTITTVGYGDIVPITTSARILVAAEAILGIILIGLFLSSLANDWQIEH